MRKTRLLTLLLLLMTAVTGAWADDSVNDLVAVGPGYTFIADNITSNGTVKLVANTLYDGGRIFAPTNNSVSTVKGSSTFAGGSHLYSLRLKNTQDQLVFKVSEPCVVTFYTQSHSSRGINVGSSAGSYDYGKQTVSTTTFKCTIPAAGLVYLSSFGGDFYFAGFEVTGIEKTVYFDNTNGWGTVNAYAWYNNGEGDIPVSAGWPGDDMTYDTEKGLYKWTTMGNPTKIIFNNSTNQTPDCDFVDGATYDVDGRKMTVTFKTDKDWNGVWVYAWRDVDINHQEETFGPWPGGQMTDNLDGTWTYTFSAPVDPEKIIFHNNNGDQTPDWDFEADKTYEYIEHTYTATFTTDKQWDEVRAYAWSGDGAKKYLGDWPGTALTAEGGVYTVSIKTYDEAPEKILFNNGKNGDDPLKEQTPDWTFVNEKAYTYMQKTYNATFTTDANWENVYAYAWTGDGDGATKYLGIWPGTALTADDEGVYSVTINTYEEAAPAKIKFNNGKDGDDPLKKQTNDQTFVNGKAYKYITATPLYALTENETFVAGTIVDVKDAENDVVATLTYGVSGGADFNETTDAYGLNDDYAGFGYMTSGNGQNGGPNTGTVYTINPFYNGTITVGVRLNGGKNFYIQEDGTSMEGYDGITISEATNTSYSFPVKAGSTYKVYCTGSKLGFFGFDYDYTKPELKFQIAGSMTGWNTIKVRSNSITFTNLAAGTYKFKVIDGENWKGFTDLTEVADNLYNDAEGNICFKLGEAGNVTVTYISGETFTVVGNFVAPTVALAGSMNEWSTTANVFTTAADQKTASMTINLATAGDYEFKIVVGDNWLSKEGEGGSKYSLHRGWRTVDGVDQFNKENFKLTTDVAGDYTFTWTYATNTLTITFPTGNLTLDEVADNAETLTNWDGTSANLTLKRTLTTGGWNTFAVPFDVSSTMLTTLKTTYGVTVKELTNASFADGTLTLTFGDAESIEAGKPYIVNVTSNFDFSEILIPGVIISKTAQPFTSTNVDFIPTLGKTTIEGDTKEILIMAGGGELKHPKTLPADMKGFRAYFQLKGEAANAHDFYFDFGNGETTGINTLDNLTNSQVDVNAPMYNLAGQRVTKSYKGVVIQNGQKMVIK